MATPIDDDTLQRFYDGELSPLEEHSLQARIEGDPDAQRRLARLGTLTELLQASAEQLGETANSSALYAAIEARLEGPGKPRLGERLRVVSSEWMEHRRGALVPLVTATAVAAATLIAVIRPNPSGQSGSQATGSEAAVAHGSRVEEVDFGTSTGTVFEIDNQGVAVAVVWISDEEEAP